MQILPPARNVYGLRAPRMATVGRLGALGATGDFSWTYNETTGVYTVNDPSTSYTVTVTASSMDAGLDAGGVPTGITWDGGLIWSNPASFAAYYGAETGLDITDPYSIPGYAPSWEPGVGPSTGLPPGVTPAEDIAFSAGSGDDVGPIVLTPEQLATLVKELAKGPEALKKAAPPEQAKELEQRAKDGTLKKWIKDNWGKTALTVLALALGLYIYYCDSTPGANCRLPDSCRTANKTGKLVDYGICVFDYARGVGPGAGGDAGAPAAPCSVDGIAKATADINAAKDADTVDRIVSDVKAACGEDSAAAKLIEQTGAAKRSRMTWGTVALWGGLGLGLTLLAVAVARSRK